MLSDNPFQMRRDDDENNGNADEGKRGEQPFQRRDPTGKKLRRGENDRHQAVRRRHGRDEGQ